MGGVIPAPFTATETRRDFYVRLAKEIQMPYAESLRAIGQSLEMVHVESFRLEKEGDSYVVRSESLTPNRLWILSNSLA
jgi:hypothetical protein